MIMSRQQFLTSAGLEVQTLDLWIDQQWLAPDHSHDELRFSDADVARAHLIRDLKGDLGVNDEGIDIILHLVDQIHGLRQMFGQLRGEMQNPSG